MPNITTNHAITYTNCSANFKSNAISNGSNECRLAEYGECSIS